MSARSGLTACVLAGVLGASGLAPAPSLAQEAPARLVAFLNEPREPELGEVFELRLQVRLAPGLIALFPDTLLPATDAVSAGEGTWTVEPADADSVDVRATYPVMGLRNGGVELPSLELWIREATANEAAGPLSLASLDPAARPQAGPTGSSSAGFQRVLISIGGVLVTPMRAMAEAAGAGALEPRPPADVLGGNWSAWFIAAVVILLLAAGFVSWALVSARSAAGGLLESVRFSPREEALKELDRIRGLGWHDNGRIPEFYEATTGVLRHFAERKETRWSTALTSSELLEELTERWGPDSVSELGTAVWSAERAKFGTYRPEPNAAEADWATVRGWIEHLPED